MSDQMSKNLTSRRSFLRGGAAVAGAAIAARLFGSPSAVLAKAGAWAFGKPSKAMAGTAWQLAGDYFEACSCDFLCPCDTSNTAKPSRGYCKVALVFHIDQGRYGTTILDDLNFVLVWDSPDVMSKGNWTAGVIIDDRATPDQQQALTAITSGKAGGVPAAVAPAYGKFLGIVSKPIQFKQDGMSRSVSVPGTLDQAIEGLPGADKNFPMYLDNIGHPANARLALAQATRRHIDFFDIKDDTTVKTNGHFAPFSWTAS